MRKVELSDLPDLSHLVSPVYNHLQPLSLHVSDRHLPPTRRPNTNSPDWIFHKMDRLNQPMPSDLPQECYTAYKNFKKHYPEQFNKLRQVIQVIKETHKRPPHESEKETEPVDEIEINQDLLQLYALHEKWNRIIYEALLVSPGYQLDGLSEEERKRKLEEEWLVKDPLTGICTGLAIDFLLHAEVDPHFSQMSPSDNARYFEQLLIPAMVAVMKQRGLENPSDLVTLEHYDAIYLEMKKCICDKANLQADFVVHMPLQNLFDQTEDLEGHQLLFLEKIGREVAANHCIYFNPTTRIIADGGSGTVIHVPEGDSFPEFLEYYVDRIYDQEYELFSIAAVSKAPDKQSIRFPSRWDQLQLKTTLFSYQVKAHITDCMDDCKVGIGESLPDEFKSFGMFMPDSKA